MCLNIQGSSVLNIADNEEGIKEVFLKKMLARCKVLAMKLFKNISLNLSVMRFDMGR
jgi:hypothetical protein